jgi:hypothetical protein
MAADADISAVQDREHLCRDNEDALDNINKTHTSNSLKPDHGTNGDPAYLTK